MEGRHHRPHVFLHGLYTRYLRRSALVMSPSSWPFVLDGWYESKPRRSSSSLHFTVSPNYRPTNYIQIAHEEPADRQYLDTEEQKLSWGDSGTQGFTLGRDLKDKRHDKRLITVGSTRQSLLNHVKVTPCTLATFSATKAF